MTTQSTMQPPSETRTTRRFASHRSVPGSGPARCWCGSCQRRQSARPQDPRRRAAHARHPLPAILGIDLAGVVEAERARRHALQAG